MKTSRSSTRNPCLVKQVVGDTAKVCDYYGIVTTMPLARFQRNERSMCTPRLILVYCKAVSAEEFSCRTEKFSESKFIGELSALEVGPV